MNKILVTAGFMLVAVTTFTIQKFVLIDLPAHDKCIALTSSRPLCSGDPFCPEVSFIQFIVEWIIVATGATLLICGLKADSVPKSRLV